MATYELHELEALPELEGAAPLWRAVYPSGELEHEDEGEAEAFFESLAEYAVGGGRGGGRGLASIAATAASAARSAGVPLATMALDFGGPAIEGELEAAIGAGGGVHPAALMEHYGHAAAMAESEAEAEAFLFPLVPLAAKFLLPKVGQLVMRRFGPRLIKGVLRAGRQLRSDPSTRQLVRVLPSVVRQTVAQVGQAAQTGAPVTPQMASNVLARQTQSVVADPRRAVAVYRRSRRLDRRYHVTVREIR
jgi:hypothetical protein